MELEKQEFNKPGNGQRGNIMVISKRYALALIKAGKAKKEGRLKPNDYGDVYTIVARYDLQRTDHYLDKKVI